MTPGRTHRYDEEGSADISAIGDVLMLDTKDRAYVSAILHSASAAADYEVKTHHDKGAANGDWTTVASHATATEFRTEFRCPERYVKIRCITAATAGDTANVSLNTTG